MLAIESFSIIEGFKQHSTKQKLYADFLTAPTTSGMSLSHSISAPNDTRWNSHLRLHEYILKHCESINKDLEGNQKHNLVLTTADKENISSVVNIMSYFAEATDILNMTKSLHLTVSS